MDLKLYRSTVPSFQPQQQNPPQRLRDFSNSTTAPMPSPAFLFQYENSNDFSSWAPPVNGNINNMSPNNGAPFQRHMASPPPPPLMNPLFHHNGFAPAPPPPQHFSSAGPVGGFQQPPFANGVISPLHSPGLGPVIPHMHNSNGNTFAPPPPSYHNIPPPPGPLGTRNQNQIPPPPNFSSFNNPMTGVMHHGSRENGVGHLGPFLTPPVSAPSSPSPPPPHMINGSIPTQPPTLNFQPSIPRTVGSRAINKSLTPPLAKSNLATSTVISRNEPAPASTNNDQSTSTTLKPKFNPNAASFQPVVKSPAIVSSTPPPKRPVTPPTKTRTHPFNPLSSHFTPSTCSTPSREEQAEKRASGKFNPGAPAFVPGSETPPLPARSSPPPNAPTGPASLVLRTNPPPGSSSIPPYPKLPLSPPTGPKADRNRIPPRPIIGLGIGMGAANEIQERGLPATTPLGPKAMSTPTGPRAERPLSRNLSSREGFHSRTYSGSEGHNTREKYTKEPAPLPTVALIRIPGVDKPVPTGPAKMLADLPPAAKILDVPTAPAAMLKSMESGSQNGSDDGSRGRPGFLRRSSSHTYTRSVNIRQWRGGVSQSRSSWVREHDDSRNVSKSRDGSVIPESVGIMEIEVTFHDSPKSEDKVPVLTEEPESYDDEAAPAIKIHEKAVQQEVEVEVEAPTAIFIEQEPIKEDDESITVIEEALFVEEPEASVGVITAIEEALFVEEPEASVGVIEEVPFVEEPEPSVAVVEVPLEESVIPEVEAIVSVEEADPEAPIEAIVPTPGLVQQHVTTDDVTEGIVMPVIDKVEEIASTTPAAIVPVALITVPSIQIVADDSSRKEVDLEKDPDTNPDSFPDSGAATTPSPRLSEISIKKREEEGDEIVSMMIEDGVVIVPTRDTPSPTAQMRAMAKKRLVKGKNKDAIAPVEEEVEESEKDRSVGVKPMVVRGSEILNVRKPKKKGKKGKKEKKNQIAAVAEIVEDAQSGSSTTAPIITNEVILETDIEAPVNQKPAHRGAVVVHGIVHQDCVMTRAVAIQKNSESGVGFIAESPLPVEPVAETGEVDTIVLDPKDEEEPVLKKAIPALMEEAEQEAAKSITLEENDNEKEHDGGVKLDVVDTLPPLREDIDEQLVKLTEIYSDSESVKDEQDDEDVVVHMEGEPIAEVKPLHVVKAATLVQLIEEEPAVIAPEPEAIIGEIAAIEKESPTALVEELVADVQEPVAVLEQPVSIVEERTTVVEDPVVTSEESPIVIELPVGIVEERTAVVEDLVTSEESPVVVELPVGIAEERTVVVEDLVVTSEESPVVVELPVGIVEERTAIVEDPVVTSEESPVVVELPVGIVEERTAIAEDPVITSEESPVVIELLEDLLVPTIEPPNVEEVVKEAAFFEPRHMHTGEIAISINSIIGAIASCKDINSLSGTLETYSRVSKPGTQEERLFRELHHYAAIADPTKKDNSDNRSTRSRSSMKSVRSFFKRRAEAYPQLLSSTTSRIKAILPPFLSMTAAPAINTIPTSGTITPTNHKNPMASTTAAKSQRPRLLPKMTMSLLSRSFSTKSQQNVIA